MLKAESKTWSASEPLDTPYKRARDVWDSRMGALLQNIRLWRLATFVCFGVVCVEGMGLIYLGQLPKLEPYIVQLNGQGQSVYKGNMGTAWSSFTPTRAAMTYHLREFIERVREISFDTELMKQRLFQAYDFVTPEAATILNDHFRERNPFTIAKTDRYTVEITAMVPVSSQTWQCDWTESQWNKQGQLQEKVDWRGMFRLTLKKPRTIQDMEKNPLGMYIREFHWSKISH